HIEVPAVKHETLLEPGKGEPSAEIQKRVAAARAIQHKRFEGGRRKARCNARMTSKDLKTHAALNEECRELLKHALGELRLSARAHDRILKVARTIADLGGKEHIDATDLSEAIQYRTLDRQLWTA